MQLFQCPNCANRIYFDNSFCTTCGASVGYNLEDNRFESIGGTAGWAYCANATEGGCNWAVREAEEAAFCLSCRLNEVIPPISEPIHRERWAKVERSKRWLVYGLRKLGLTVLPRAECERGLAFRILVDEKHGGDRKVSMGHEAGVITIDSVEADAPERESRRVELGESFRTLLGHVRHESGHYYWDRLIAPTTWLDDFRALFGDETVDYAQALEHHYSDGPPQDWQVRFISAYASMHPWEDWAETWAHYLHMTDAVETAAAGGFWRADKQSQPLCGDAAFDSLYDRWQDVILLMNSMNRSLGHRDFYPFVVAEVAKEKLRFVHRVIGSHRALVQ